ncbi:MAG TPA: Na+/glucose cotransporter, partial [Bacteroidales bacterium]|nr:Na+/glucose cotransporter [Bacteroidales bacterium]
GWSEMMEVVRAAPVNDYGDSMANLIRSPHDAEFPWTGVLLGSAIIGFWYWCTDQYIVQRVLSARNMTQARRGSIFGAYLKLTPVFIFLIPGMIAYVMNQKGMIQLSSNDAAFSTLVKELLPMGFKGVVVGGLLAALMSSLASLFNSSAMLFTIDFYKKYKPNASERHYVLVGKIATAVVVILGILWIPIMRGLGKVLYAYLQDVQSLLAPGIAAVFLLGILSKRTTPKAGLYGLIVGFVLGMLRLGLKLFADTMNPDGIIYRIFLAPNWLHYEIALFFIVIVLMIIISSFTKPKDFASLKGLTLASVTPEQLAEVKNSYSKWDILNTAIIIGVIVAFYVYFW